MCLLTKRSSLQALRHHTWHKSYLMPPHHIPPLCLLVLKQQAGINDWLMVQPQRCEVIMQRMSHQHHLRAQEGQQVLLKQLLTCECYTLQLLLTDACYCCAQINNCTAWLHQLLQQDGSTMHHCYNYVLAYVVILVWLHAKDIPYGMIFHLAVFEHSLGWGPYGTFAIYEL